LPSLARRTSRGDQQLLQKDGELLGPDEKPTRGEGPHVTCDPKTTTTEGREIINCQTEGKKPKKGRKRKRNETWGRKALGRRNVRRTARGQNEKNKRGNRKEETGLWKTRFKKSNRKSI